MHRFDDTRYYRTTDSELTIIATRGTMAQWRHRGEGPPYIRFGNRVLYYGSDLNRFLDSNLVEPVKGQAAACVGRIPGDPHRAAA